jgi:hypothetical protein
MTWPGQRLHSGRRSTLVKDVLVVALVASIAAVAVPRPAKAAQSGPPVAARSASAVRCPGERPDTASAAIAAKLCGGRVGVTNLTTETTLVWANADGTMSAEQHLAPVRVRVGNSWVPVDLTLQRRPDGSVEPKAHAIGVVLSGGAQGSGEHDVVALGAGEQRVAIRWSGALPAPVLDGSVATYRDVRPGVDLVVRVNRTGYEQSFVVKDKAGLAQVNRLSLPMATGKGLSASVDGTGGIVLRNGTVEVGRTHPAEMWDASVAPESLDHLRRAPVAMGLRAVAPGRMVLDLIPDAAFLSRSDLQFPVTIDPPSSLNPSFDAFVQTGYISDQSGADELKLGYSDDGGTWTARSYLTFNTSGMWDQQVLDGTLHLWEWHSWSCRKAQWEARRSGTVSAATLRWSSQPTWYEQIGVSDQTTGYSSSCADGWVSIQLKSGFQSAASGHWSTLTTVLKAVSETNHDGWKRFDSMEGAHDPYVTFTYNAAPDVPSALTVAPCYTSCGSGAAVGATRPTLSATVTDPNPGDSVRAEFEVWNAGHTTLVASSGLLTGVATGTSVPWQVSTDLATGSGYEWRVRGYDGRNYGAWSGWTTMTVDTTRPGVPFVSASLYAEDGQPHGGAGVADQFTFSPATGTSDLGAYVYQLDTSSSQTTVAATGSITVSITPPSDGHRTLTVYAKDRAGNLSNPKVYQFQVGAAALSQPLPGAVVAKRTKVAVDTVVPQYTRAYFEYRRGPGGTVLTVPSAHLSTATGAPVTATAASPVTLSSLGGYANWNALATLGSVAGVVEVRAQMYTATSPTPVYATAWVRITVDPNGDGAATAEVGPGSANLLTGDLTLSTTDSDDLGLTSARTASSREPADGFVAMAERLTANQQQVATDLTGFTVPATSTAARVTTLGQGEPVTPGVYDSLEITPVTGNDTYVAVGGDNGALRLSTQAGKTYRMTGWIYVPSATGLVPSHTTRGLRIVAFYKDSGGAYHEFASAKAGYLDAWQELSVDLPLPAGATEAFFRLYSGMQGGSGRKVYWDHLSMTEIVSPFGPSWVGGATAAEAGAEYTTLTFPQPSVARVDVIGGGWITFSRNADGVTFTPEPGYAGTVLTKDTSTYRLTELDGGGTEFTQVGGVWTATSSWTSDANSTVRYVYDTS